MRTEIQTSDDPQVLEKENPWGMPARTILLLVGLWLVAATLMAVVLSAQEGLGFRYSFSSAATDLAILAVLLAGVWFLIHRFHETSLVFKVCLHAALAAIVVPTWEMLKRTAMSRMASPEIVEIYVEEAGYWAWLQSFTFYAAAVAGLLVIHAFRRLREEERRASRLQILNREAELRALRAQLRPHFLFNTLNSIYSLIPSRPEEAAEMVALLSDLLRETLEHSDQSTVPLENELQLVERYLSIESVRMGDRLQVEIDADPDTLQAEVPPFLLQPLVENAIRHGAAPSLDLVTVRVEARRNGDRITLRVIDDGCGPGQAAATVRADLSEDTEQTNATNAWTPRAGHGLRITRSRLEVHHGPDFDFGLAARSPQGCIATVEIPFGSEA